MNFDYSQYTFKKALYHREIENNIRRLRKEKGLRQIDLAIAVGIDSSYLSEIENKKRNPTILLLDNIATVLEVSLIELLTDNSK